MTGDNGVILELVPPRGEKCISCHAHKTGSSISDKRSRDS